MISRLARHLPLRLAFFTLLAAVLVWPVLGDAARLNEFRDVHHLFLYERSAIDTIKRYGELPLWNPYYCGGFDAVAAPQTRFVSPTLLLGLLFGAERAEILTVFFFAIVGMEGMYRWLRLRTTEPLAALVVAPIFALSGQYAVAYNRGWIQFMGFQLVPWILYGITLAARRKWQGMAVASIAFAWMLGFAGFFAAPLVAVAAVLRIAARAHRAAPKRAPAVHRDARGHGELHGDGGVRALVAGGGDAAVGAARDGGHTGSCAARAPVGAGRLPRHQGRQHRAARQLLRRRRVPRARRARVASSQRRGEPPHRAALRLARVGLCDAHLGVRTPPRGADLRGRALSGALLVAGDPLRERRGRLCARARALHRRDETMARRDRGRAHRGRSLHDRLGNSGIPSRRDPPHAGHGHHRSPGRVPPGARKSLARGAPRVAEHRLARLLRDASSRRVDAAPRRSPAGGVPRAGRRRCRQGEARLVVAEQDRRACRRVAPGASAREPELGAGLARVGGQGGVERRPPRGRSAGGRERRRAHVLAVVDARRSGDDADGAPRARPHRVACAASRRALHAASVVRDGAARAPALGSRGSSSSPLRPTTSGRRRR